MENNEVNVDSHRSNTPGEAGSSLLRRAYAQVLLITHTLVAGWGMPRVKNLVVKCALVRLLQCPYDITYVEYLVVSSCGYLP